MTNLKIRLAAGFTTAAILATSFAPAAFAATDVTVTGNGAGSLNKVKVKNINKTRVRQSNSTAVVNLTGVFQNTGGNTANNNTGGGNVDVNSGDATSNVTNRTRTGGNDATVNPCGCPTGDTTITISDNGADSTNKVKVYNTNRTTVGQTNETLVVNGTLVAQNTGGNHANNNTGDGSVDVDSGNASSTVTNTVTTGGNVLN